MLHLVSLAAVAVLALSPSVTAKSPEEQGRRIAVRDCGGCHAVGPRGPSRMPPAPPFRELGQRYDPDALAEALAEGISVGHPMMPERVYAPDSIKALLAYLHSLQPVRPHVSGAN